MQKVLSQFVGKYCLKCHDIETQKGDLEFESFKLPLATLAELITAKDMVDQLTLREMPPSKAKQQPTDDERLLKEISFFADRADISEELTRLESHLAQFAHHLRKNEPVGRTLEFIIQEIFRELNTLGAKANDAAISQRVVASKAELEKIREQVQNLE